MRKINLNIKIPQVPNEERFDEETFRKAHPDLYEKFVIKTDGNPNKLSDIEIVKNWIGNWLAQAINYPEENGKRKDQAKRVPMEDQRKYARIMNALDAEKEGWIKLEDADFDNLIKWWESSGGGYPVAKYISILLDRISSAFDEAKLHKGNPE